MAEQKTILYVDDEEDMRVIVQSTLEDSGYRVLTAPDAPTGLKLAFAEFPDLIISDVMMPGESGFSLCEKLKADPSTKAIPVVFLSVMDEESRGIDVGASAFLGKPFEVDQLRATVAGILDSQEDRSLLESALEDLRAGRRDDAVSGFQEVVRSQGGTATARWARYYLAQVLDKEGHKEKASEELHTILKQDPDFYRAHNRLGLMAEAEDDLARAVQHFERSLALRPEQADVQKRLDALRERQTPDAV